MTTPQDPNTAGQPIPGQPVPPPSYGQGSSPAYGQGTPPSYGQASPPAYGQGTETTAGQVPPPGSYSVAGGQQPPGGSYFPPAPGSDPNQPFPGQPAAPVKKKNPKWVWPLVAVLVIGVALGAWLLNRDNVSNAEVGDCVVVQSDSDFKIVDCNSAEAEYKVISIDDTDASALACSGDDVDASIYTKGGSDSKNWCLQGLWKEGDCLKSDGSDRVDCATATSSDLKVVKVLEGTQDEQGCPEETTTYRSYTDANKVLCMTPAA